MTALRGLAKAAPHVATRLGWMAFALAVALTAGAVATAIAPSDRTVLLTVTALVLLAPLVYRLGTRQYDLLEPIVAGVGVLMVMFVLRPAELIRYGVFRDSVKVYDVSATFVEAQFVALVGCIGLVIGYFLPFAKRLGPRIRALPDDLDESLAVGISVFLILLGFAGYSLFAIQAGHSPLVLFSGELHVDSAKSTAYLYNAPYVCIPAAMVLIRIGLSRGRRALAAGAILLVAFFIHSLAPSGQRLWLLLLVMSLFVYPMLRSGWRPPGWAVALAMIPVMLLMISMRDLNHGHGKTLPTEIVETIQYPGDGWREFITGADTEMFSMLAVELSRVPEALPYQPGNVAMDVLTQPIPHQLYPGTKPASADGILNEHLYAGRTGRRANQAGAGYSLIGVYYLEGGIIPVFFGMALLGFAMRVLWCWKRAHPGNQMVLLVYASALPLTLVVLRGNPSDTLARSFFTVGPILLVAWLAQRRRPVVGVNAAS